MSYNLQSSFLWCCFCFCAFLSSTATGDPVVTSIVKMTKLAQFEQDLVVFARHSASSLPPQFVNFVSSVQAEYARHGSPSRFIDFPINQYRLIRRFSYDWPVWQELLRLSEVEDHTTEAAKFLTFYTDMSEEYGNVDKFNSGFDLPVAGFTLARLHILYRDKARLLAGDGPSDCPPLSEMELLELCANALNNVTSVEDVAHAFHWMTAFVERMKPFLPYSSVMSIIKYVIQHSDIYGRPDYQHYILPVRDGIERLDVVVELLEKYPRRLQDYYEGINEDLETEVCRSYDERKLHGIYCFLFHTPRTPYAPFRYEILSLDPYVAFVHNFMPRQMTRRFISTATDSGSRVNEVVSGYSPETGDAINTVEVKIRLSESTVLNYVHPVNTWLDYQVEHATLMLPNSQPMRSGARDGELNHMLHYGLSGHYVAHHDYADYDMNFPKMGNRLATVLVYLTDVQSGGHTAFPHLNVSVPPQAGAALVWFNLDPRRGYFLPHTLHVACPVNVGKKWVINRWVRTHLKTGHLRPVLK